MHQNLKEFGHLPTITESSYLFVLQHDSSSWFDQESAHGQHITWTRGQPQLSPHWCWLVLLFPINYVDVDDKISRKFLHLDLCSFRHFTTSSFFGSFQSTIAFNLLTFTKKMLCHLVKGVHSKGGFIHTSWHHFWSSSCTLMTLFLVAWIHTIHCNSGESIQCHKCRHSKYSNEKILLITSDSWKQTTLMTTGYNNNLMN